MAYTDNPLLEDAVREVVADEVLEIEIRRALSAHVDLLKTRDWLAANSHLAKSSDRSHVEAYHQFVGKHAGNHSAYESAEARLTKHLRLLFRTAFDSRPDAFAGRRLS